MREIKFRGKRKDNGEWVYGYYIVAGGMAFISTFGVREPIAVIPETVGQYTGLRDKNGKEIYEGDWVMLKGVKCLISLSETSGAWNVSYPIRDDYDFPLQNLLYWWYYMGTPDIELIAGLKKEVR